MSSFLGKGDAKVGDGSFTVAGTLRSMLGAEIGTTGGGDLCCFLLLPENKKPLKALFKGTINCRGAKLETSRRFLFPIFLSTPSLDVVPITGIDTPRLGVLLAKVRRIVFEVKCDTHCQV